MSAEIRRIVIEQLDLAASELKSLGDPESDQAIHDARRRVKKIRAVVRLVRPVLDKAYRAVDADLSDVSQLLAPVADGQGVVNTINVLAERYSKLLPRRTASSIKSELLEREKRIDAQAKAEHVLRRAMSTLRSERARVKRWQLRATGFDAIAPGLKESFRRARDGMLTARLHPTPEKYRTWRRHVKDHWFHIRLIEARCGNQLMTYQKRLEALDGILGEYHNLILLRDVLVTDSGLSRREAAQCLKVIAKYQRSLRRDAQILGGRVYSERPRRAVRRIKKLWDQAPHASDGRARVP